MSVPKCAFSVAAVLAAALLPASPAHAAPQLQVFFQSRMASPAYQKQVFERVGNKFKAPPRRALPAAGKKAVVQAVIGRDGKLVSRLLSMQSGSSAWDKAALRAVTRAAPLPKLPAEYTLPTVEVHFHFGWSPSR